MILETDRLILRNWQTSDLNCYLKLSIDVGYNCFTQPGRFLVRSNEEALEKIQERITLFDEHGLGKFPIFLKASGEFLGTCGMEPYELDSQPEVELGYRLCLKHWGRGYATESAAAILRYGFGNLNLERIIAYALPQNSASLKVLEKLGGFYLRTFDHNELPHRLYEFPRNRFMS